MTGSITAGIGSVALGAESVEPDPPQKLMATPAVVMAPRSDGVEVVWSVTRLCRGWVEWRLEGGGEIHRCAADDFGFVPQGDSILRVRLEGLEAGKNHELRVVVESGDGDKAREETPWKKFRTLDPAAAAASFVVWNDTHQNDETIRKLHELTPSADFLLWNGDTCNDWHKEEWLVPTLLHPAGQDISAGRPVLLTWGNHDVRGKWAFRVKDMMAMPHGRPFYAFRNGPVAFISLHTGEDKPDNHPSFAGRVAFQVLRAEQAKWLEKITQLPEIKSAPYKVVFCHIPLRWIREHGEPNFAGGGYNHFARECRMEWNDALVKWGAQVVISGHTHEEAWIPADDRFSYGQLISGGPKPAAARWIEGKADGEKLSLIMRDLDGKVIHDVKIFPA